MEFYRYVPKDSPREQVFRVTGVQVSLENSDSRRVELSRVNLDTSGTFMCEVSGEAPRFQTVEARADLTIIKPPTSPPTLSRPDAGFHGKRYRVERRQDFKQLKPGLT